MKKKGLVHSIKQVGIGAIVGMGGITPGFSGGIMAVAFGIYHDMIAALSNILKDPKKSILYLAPLAIGMLIGILIMSNVIELLMLHWQTPFMFLIIGLVAGGVPSIVKEGNKKQGFHPKYIIAAAAGFIFIMLFSLIETQPPLEDVPTFSNPIFAILCGAILSISAVIPGLGSSFLLIYLGWYGPLLSAINRLDIGIILLVLLGFIVAIIFISKGIKKVFDRHSDYAYYTVLGFAIASIIMVFPPVSFDVSLILYILLAIGGYFVTRLMTRERGNKNKLPQSTV